VRTNNENRDAVERRASQRRVLSFLVPAQRAPFCRAGQRPTLRGGVDLWQFGCWVDGIFVIAALPITGLFQQWGDPERGESQVTGKVLLVSAVCGCWWKASWSQDREATLLASGKQREYESKFVTR